MSKFNSALNIFETTSLALEPCTEININHIHNKDIKSNKYHLTFYKKSHIRVASLILSKSEVKKLIKLLNNEL